VGTGAHHDVGAHPVRLALGALQTKWRANALAWRSRYCATAASAVASQLPLQRCFYSPLTWVKCPASFAARRPLQRSRLSCRFSGASAVFTPRASAAPRRSLRDGRFSGRVSAAASAVLLQSCVQVDVGAHPVRLALGALQTKWRANALAWRSRYCATAASAVASQLPLQRCFYSPLTWVKCPASFAARRPLQRSRLSCRFSGASAVFPPRASAAPRRCCATAITMVASRRPLQRSRLQSALRSSSLSALQQVAGHCPRSAESLLRDGHRNGRVSAAVTTVAPTISLLTWVKCPASMLRDGHYNGSVAAAVTTVSPMQSCLHVVGLGRSTLWASIERACQSVPASRAEGELHQQG